MPKLHRKLIESCGCQRYEWDDDRRDVNLCFIHQRRKVIRRNWLKALGVVCLLSTLSFCDFGRLLRNLDFPEQKAARLSTLPVAGYDPVVRTTEFFAFPGLFTRPVEGKSIAEARLTDREVALRFTDGTWLRVRPMTDKTIYYSVSGQSGNVLVSSISRVP